MTEEIKVFNMDDCDYWAGKDIESVTKAFIESTGVKMEPDYPIEVSEEEMSRLQFVDQVGFELSFKEELADRILSGNEFPQFFATTEF